MKHLIDYVKKLSLEEFTKKIDHTILKPNATLEDVYRVLREVEEYKFAVAVVPPWTLPFIERKRKTRLCTVVGFPHGNVSKKAKVEEARQAINYGVREVDMVMNIQALKSRMWDYVREDVEGVVRLAHENGVLVKVIIECGLLSDDEIVKASKIVVEAGGDYVKTSTGFGPRGATVHDIVLIRSTVKDRAKVKASGGIRRVEDAISMLLAGADRIGTSSGVDIAKGFIEFKEKLREL